MSVVIGLKYNNKCWLACDKQVVSGNMKLFLSESHNKIFPVMDRPGVIIGGVGFLRGINLLEANNSYIDEITYLKKGLDYNYMVNVFPILLNKLFVENGFVSAEENELRLKGAVIVAIDDMLYAVDHDGSVLEIDEYAAIGTGEELAYGSIRTNLNNVPEGEELDDDDIVAILTMAVEAASCSTSCGGGVSILNSEGFSTQFSF